jgi:hypothetical protein
VAGLLGVYVEDFKIKEGVSLDLEKISYNPGLRSLAKLMLNSFWGRFGMRENLTKHCIVDTRKKFLEILVNPSNEVINTELLSEEKLLISWKARDEVVVGSKKSNVVIASYTTAMARMKLYSYLEQLGTRVLYYDTDSVIYVNRPGDVDVETGDYLGEMTDELQEYGEGSYISEFVSGGPKNYAYKVAVKGDLSNVKTVCKVRGITLNYNVSKTVNIDVMKGMILNKDPPVLVHNPSKIVRVKHFKIASRPESKMYRIVVTKRRLVENFDTLPYGYKRARLE